MREIKFRAWLKNEKKMVEVEEIDFIGLNFIGLIGQKQIAYDEIEYRYTYKEPFHYTQWVDFDEIELMQYTGLKDKNGVEIYEGDILKARPYGGEFIGKVCYTGFAYEVLEKTNDPFEDSGYKPMTCIESNVLYEAMKGHSLFGNRLEVIGNIYENPELLEK